MKTLRTTLAALMISLSSLMASATPMSYYVMRDNARFLTDRMVRILNLNAALIDELYCINFDYICGVNDYLDEIALGRRYDDYITVLSYRDAALRRLLTEVEWRLLMTYDYFYRPITFVDNRWSFGIYAYHHHSTTYYYAEPRYYADYHGGRHFGGMAPNHGTIVVNNVNISNTNINSHNNHGGRSDNRYGNNNVEKNNNNRYSHNNVGNDRSSRSSYVGSNGSISHNSNSMSRSNNIESRSNSSYSRNSSSVSRGNSSMPSNHSVSSSRTSSSRGNVGGGRR
ncbi:MAG: hypothetical protein KBT06_01720 [Prevotellaceae bacterium]|nr:hypothetical protein [Candidatus Colivivens equi]MCQ2076665.1 hypothetical protein [Bacteroidaceae bacterium]